jgi:predicted small lipoprotein YifL
VQRRRARWGLLLLAFLLTACGKPEPIATPPAEVDPLAAVPPERVFKGLLGGKPVHLVVHECKVFRATADEGGWQMVLEPEPYPFFTSCQRQTLLAEGGAVTVTLGRIAFGAGGCCATGGTYRSKDGVLWKKL